MIRGLLHLSRATRHQLEEHWASIPKVIGSIPTAARQTFQPCPVWIYTQSNITNIIFTSVHNTAQTKITCIIIVIWVDDFLISASNSALLLSVKDRLSSRFKMKDLGVLHWFLGTQFKCSDVAIEMNQTRYIQKLLSTFRMTNCYPKTTPSLFRLD